MMTYYDICLGFQFSVCSQNHRALVDIVSSVCLHLCEWFDMQMVRIKFSDAATEATGFVTLAKRVKVICFSDNSYEFTRSGLKLLDELGITYNIIAEEGFDSACHALRNSAAPKV
jgi:hypothetical protein